MPFDVIPSNDTIQKLEQMYELLNRRGGWIQRAMYSRRDGLKLPGNDQFCIIGAAHQVGLYDPIILARVLKFSDTFHLIDWNDNPSRRKSQVLQRIQDAIERERELLLQKQ